MVTSGEQMPSLEEAAQMLGFELRVVPDFRPSDEYGGFIVTTGKAEQMVSLLKQFVQAGGAFKEYRLMNILRQTANIARRGGWGPADLDVYNAGGELRMVRVQTTGPSPTGELELAFGGGGNMTTLEEMKYVMEKTIEQMLAATT